jgi:hypothetical protein
MSAAYCSRCMNVCISVGVSANRGSCPYCGSSFAPYTGPLQSIESPTAAQSARVASEPCPGLSNCGLVGCLVCSAIRERHSKETR